MDNSKKRDEEQGDAGHRCEVRPTRRGFELADTGEYCQPRSDLAHSKHPFQQRMPGQELS